MSSSSSSSFFQTLPFLFIYTPFSPSWYSYVFLLLPVTSIHDMDKNLLVEWKDIVFTNTLLIQAS